MPSSAAAARRCSRSNYQDVEALQGKVGAKATAKSSYLKFEGYFLEFVRMEIWYKLMYTHSWFGTRKNMRQRVYHFITHTHGTDLLNRYF